MGFILLEPAADSTSVKESPMEVGVESRHVALCPSAQPENGRPVPKRLNPLGFHLSRLLLAHTMDS
jgi:hypothetical protein